MDPADSNRTGHPLESEKKRDVRRLARYSALGTEFVIGSLLGFYLGYQIDRWFGWPPVVLTILLPFLFASVGFIGLFREFARSSAKRRETQRPNTHEPGDSGGSEASGRSTRDSPDSR